MFEESDCQAGDLQKTMAPSDAPLPTAEQHGSDRRGSYRFPTAEPSLARLVVGDKQWPVQIMDESAGGLGVCSLERLEVDLGDLVELRTDSGWFELRVVRVDHSDDHEALGLERIRELPIVVDCEPNVFRQLLRILVPKIDIAQAVPAVFGLLLAVVVVSLPVLLSNWHHGRGMAGFHRDTEPTTKRPASSAQPARPTPLATNTAWRSVLPPTEKLLRLRIFDLQILADPKTIRHLTISPAQQREILALLESLDSRGPAAKPDAPLAAPLVEKLRDILTADQVRRLQTWASSKAPIAVHADNAPSAESESGPGEPSGSP